MWVCDALDEGEEFGQEEEGEAADIDMEVANEDGKLVDVLDAEGLLAAKRRHGFNKSKLEQRQNELTIKFETGDSGVGPKLSVIRRMKCEAEDMFEQT